MKKKTIQEEIWRTETASKSADDDDNTHFKNKVKNSWGKMKISFSLKKTEDLYLFWNKD